MIEVKKNNNTSLALQVKNPQTLFIELGMSDDSEDDGGWTSGEIEVKKDIERHGK